MTEGVDYAFPPLPSAGGLAAAGKTFAGRYVGPGSGKFLTAGERDALFANGIDIFLLAEGSADSARGGRPIGRQHAQQALDHARSLGAPDSAAVYFAVDYDLVTTGDWAAAREYLAGAGEVLGVGRVGVYGEHDVMVWAARDGVASWFFQTYAWSNGQWYGGNHVEQYLNGQYVAGGEVDLCRLRQAKFGQWAANPAEEVMSLKVLHYGDVDQGNDWSVAKLQHDLRRAGVSLDVTRRFDDATAKALVDLGLTGSDGQGHTYGDTEDARLQDLIIDHRIGKAGGGGGSGAIPAGTRFTAVTE